MIPRGLFVRLFTWFWVSVTLVAAGNVLVMALNRPREFQDAHRQRSARMLRLLADGELVAQGESRVWIERVKRDFRMEIIRIDAAGRPVGGGAMTPEVAEVVGRIASGENDAVVEVPGGYWIAVPMTVAGGDGGYAAALVRMRPPQPFDFLWRGPVGWRLALMFLLSGIISLVLARSLSSPLRSLRDTAQRLAAGDLSARVPPGPLRRGDEIAELAGDFDLMAERLDRAMTSQKQLLTDISHELRSPLARLNVALELARRQTGPEQAKSLDRIGREAERMNGMIGQILSLSRMEIGEAQRGLVALELNALVEGVVRDADFEARAEGKGVGFAAGGPITVTGNEVLLAGAIENVVRNAVRHTAEGTTVEVSLAVVGDRAEVTVRDRGPGVPEGEREQIFLPFHRVGPARDRESGGAGLGLAIVRRTLGLHGGTVTADNHPDGGLVVTISLPRG